jgi:hypothetical protein
MKALGALAFCAPVAAACGPSFQAVYECDVHFEHCYAVDMSEVPSDAKRQCWREWLAGYTYGQARDRVEHAKTRVAELAPDALASSVDAGVGVAATVAAPTPTSAFAPPPGVSDDRGISREGTTADAGGAVPGAACSDACSTRLKACRSNCNGASCAACDHAYRTCMPPCFREDSDAGHPPPRHPKS